LGDGSRQLVDAKVGDNLLDVITENEIDLDGFGELICISLIPFSVAIAVSEFSNCSNKF